MFYRNVGTGGARGASAPLKFHASICDFAGAGQCAYNYMYSTLQMQGIKQTRLRLNKTRFAFAENAFSVAFERV